MRGACARCSRFRAAGDKSLALLGLQGSPLHASPLDSLIGRGDPMINELHYVAEITVISNSQKLLIPKTVDKRI